MHPQELEQLESLVSRLLAAVTASEATGTTVDVTDDESKDDDHESERTFLDLPADYWPCETDP